MVEFTPWPKIARLNRDIVITEKIDGTNAAIGVREFEGDLTDQSPYTRIATKAGDPFLYEVYAQSRSRLITPDADNFGFARWVFDNAATLVADLGEGLHFGEWWGSGIQRGYGLEKGEKRFSLFNSSRWEGSLFATPGVAVVPVLFCGLHNTRNIDYCLEGLLKTGSHAAPGFMKPEGIVVYHVAARTMFKVTLEGDEKHKGE